MLGSLFLENLPHFIFSMIVFKLVSKFAHEIDFIVTQAQLSYEVGGMDFLSIQTIEENRDFRQERTSIATEWINAQPF